MSTTPGPGADAIVLAPIPGEALPSYLSRVAAARFCSRAELGWHHSEDVLRHGATVDLDLVADRVGVPVATLATLTALGYGPAVTGRTIPGARRTRWRIPAQQRRCPACPPGHRLAAWDLGLHLACREHRRLVVPLGWSAAQPAIPPGDPLLGHDSDVTATLAQVADPNSRARLRLAHRLALLLSLTAGATWPATPSPYLETLRTDIDWDPDTTRWTTTHTPDHPVVLAVLVIAAWDATRAPRHTRTLAAEAWQRVDAAGLDLPPRTIKSLPPRPRERNRSPRLTPVRAFRADTLRYGLQPRQVPFLLHDGDGLFPPVHQIPQAHALARLLLHLLDPDNTARLPAASTLRIGPTLGRDPLRDVRLSGGVDPEAATALRTHLHRLAQSDVDYQHRRHLLSGLRSISSGRLPGRRRWPDRAEELAAGWIWADLTRGPLVRSRHRYRNTDLLAFDRALDPEQRLALREYGEILLGEADGMVAGAHPPVSETHAESGRRSG